MANRGVPGTCFAIIRNYIRKFQRSRAGVVAWKAFADGHRAGLPRTSRGTFVAADDRVVVFGVHHVEGALGGASGSVPFYAEPERMRGPCGR